MADCQEQEQAFDNAFDQMADSLFDVAVADRIENDANKALIATSVGGIAARHLEPPNPEAVEKVTEGFNASVDAMNLSQQMAKVAQGRFDKAKENFEKAVKELCHCWEAQEDDDSQRLAGDEGDDDGDGDDGDDDGDDEFDEMLEEAEDLLAEVDEILEEVEELLKDALDEDGEGEGEDAAVTSDVALVS